MIDFSKYILHDLSHTYEKGLPGYDWEQARTRLKDGWNGRTLHMYSHIGTHMDAQAHFLDDGNTIDQFTPEQLTGRAWVVRHPVNKGKSLLGNDVLAAIEDRWKPGDSLLIHTGWDKYLAADYDHWRNELPRISEQLARWCVDNQVKMLGVEGPSVADVNDLPEVTLIHEILLSGEVIIIEALTGLHKIRKDQVDLIALPLKIGGGDGAPARVIALEER